MIDDKESYKDVTDENVMTVAVHSCKMEVAPIVAEIMVRSSHAIIGWHGAV